MTQVGVYEAKTRLPKLLDQVAKGRRITITRHGTPVAMLIPAAAARRRAVDDVIAELQEFGRGRRLGRFSIRAMIEKGRR